MYYYEAKVSYLMIGLDDFFFTTYLLVDTYHGGSETDREDYVDYDVHGLDPASMRPFEFPFWNPREHIFAALATRLGQVTMEVDHMVLNLDKFMRGYVGFISRPTIIRTYNRQERDDCFDTMDLSQTQDLLPTVDTLHELKSSVQGLVLAWSRFASSQFDWLKATEYGALAESIGTYQREIEAHITELERHEQLLEERCVQFEGRLNRVSSTLCLCIIFR